MRSCGVRSVNTVRHIAYAIMVNIRPFIITPVVAFRTVIPEIVCCRPAPVYSLTNGVVYEVVMVENVIERITSQILDVASCSHVSGEGDAEFVSRYEVFVERVVFRSLYGDAYLFARYCISANYVVGAIATSEEEAANNVWVSH